MRFKKNVLRLAKSDKGQSLVEIAVLLPVLLLLLVGVVEVGYSLYAYLLVVRASQEGVRLEANGGNDTDVTTAALVPLSPLSPSGKVDVYVIHGTTASNGSFSGGTWNVNHTLASVNPTTPLAAATVESSLLPGGTRLGSVKITTVQVFYRHQPMLGLDFGPFAGGMPMSVYTIQRDVGP